jgi:aryl-alcohol dehydrogenase-like predicted oxidoreductase
LCVSDTILGTMTWGGDTPEEECRRLLTAAAEAGVNTLDTAPVYENGEGERIIGRLLKRSSERGSWVLSTKFGMSTRPNDPNAGRAHRGTMIDQVNASLTRLRTDHIDILWQHAYDEITPIEEVIATANTLVNQGKIRYFGMSNTRAHVTSRAATLAEVRGWCPVGGIQVPYSLAQRAIERDQLTMAVDYGLTTITWAPLAHGLLTGRFGTERRPPKDTTRLTTDQYGFMLTDQNLAVADRVNKVAAARGDHPVQVALGWLRAQRKRWHTRIVPIVGARTHNQLQVSLSTCDDLTTDELAMLDDANPGDLGFPHDYDEAVADLVYGHTRHLISTTIDI